MRSDTAAQTAATVFLAVLMAAALLLVDGAGLPFGMERVPPAGGSDSYEVLRLPFSLADLLTGNGGGQTPPREVAAPAETTTGPLIANTDSTPDSLSLGDTVGRAASRLPAVDPTTTSRPQSDRAAGDRNDRVSPGGVDGKPSRRGNQAQPIEPTGRTDRDRPGSKGQGRGHNGAPVRDSVKDGRDGRRSNTAAMPRSDNTSSQRDRRVTASAHRDHGPAAAVKGKSDQRRDRTSAQRKGSARPRHARRSGK